MNKTHLIRLGVSLQVNYTQNIVMSIKLHHLTSSTTEAKLKANGSHRYKLSNSRLLQKEMQHQSPHWPKASRQCFTKKLVEFESYSAIGNYWKTETGT
jgi:hypothetical protein